MIRPSSAPVINRFSDINDIEIEVNIFLKTSSVLLYFLKLTKFKKTMNIFNCALLVLAIQLLTTLFFSKNSISNYIDTVETNSQLIAKNIAIKKSNLIIKNRVGELKAGGAMTEEIAREELNLIKANEVFIQTNH